MKTVPYAYELPDKADVQVMVGSGLLWAWFDALFMSAFHAGLAPASSLMAEGAAMAMDGMSALVFAIALACGSRAQRALDSRGAMLACAILGTVGSGLFALSGVAGGAGGWALLVLGGLCGGTFATAYQLGWGAAYCQRGSRSALLRVAGAFACAVVLDVPLLVMVPAARAFFFALFPLACGLMFARLDPAERRYPEPAAAREVPYRPGLRGRLHVYLGLSGMIVGGLTLAMFGFGYMQHLVSFATPAASAVSWGVVVQVARGVVSVAVFAGVVFAPYAMGAVYRAGLLVMVAGFMANAVFLGTDAMWVPGVILICGYTVFDVMVWVVVAQVAFAQSKSPMKTIALVRMLAGACYVLGAAAGIAFAGTPENRGPYMMQESNLVGYLVVIAVVFLMSSEDIWVLFNAYRLVMIEPGIYGPAGDEEVAALVRGPAGRPAPAEAEVPARGGRDVRLDGLGLTAREREVAELVARGRTQPWIAEALGISGNTVGTHMRHLYQKAGVHNRQEFIDLLMSDR